MKLTLKDVYIGTERHGRPWDRGPKAFVLGVQFGPMLLVASESCEEALNEWDERHGQRLDDDMQALADYDGATDHERIESAMNCGDIRINDGGTTIWVDHYEWIREFDTIREAGMFFRGVSE
jgi:hypothetical protein